MLHLKSYVGSIVLAALLLQGCGGSDTATTSSEAPLTAAQLKTQATVTALSDTLAQLNGTESNSTIDTTFNNLKLQLSSSSATTTSGVQAAGLFSSVTDKLKNTLEGLADTSVGNKVTSATFDVVLNSDGVTVVMLDAARKSHTITKVMIDALDADWSLTKKMIPMLQTNKEFGEKFAALAYEEPDMARFFFSRVDAPMYNALADAMLLSNDDSVHDSSVEHSTNGYMGLLMDMYAEEYFVKFNSGAHKTAQTATVAEDGHKAGEEVKYAKNDATGNLATDDNFVNLLADTKAVVHYDSATKKFTGHGDGNELINEKFFYSLFKTPGSTDSFVTAMKKLPDATVTELMDNIFLGQGPDSNDTEQGYLNIIAIGSAMYDGIYGKTATNSPAYGFGSYTGAFIGFATLIPRDRYITYGKAFINAGYKYAEFHGITIPSSVGAAWDYYNANADSNTTTTSSAGAPARSAGKGIISSDWTDDVLDILSKAWSNSVSTLDFSTLLDAFNSSNTSIVETLKDSANVAYHTVLDGKDENNQTVLYTELSNGTVHNDTVYGLHGLIELAMQEDIYYGICGNRSTDYILTATPTCDNNNSYTMDNAKAAFTLPAFANITMSFVYNTATDGAMAYYNNNVDANWIADLSSNELVRSYFYPSADNIYIPSWLLAIDWLRAPANYENATVATTNFDFNAGYFDIYVTSTNNHLLTDDNVTNETADINLAAIAGLLKPIEVSRVDMGSDTIIVVDENGTTPNGLYVYKVRLVTPEDTQAVMNALGDYSTEALTAIGFDSSNASNVDTTNQ